MKHSKLFVLAFLMLSLVLVGYQCGSTEITSAKLYIQQKIMIKLSKFYKRNNQNPKSDEGYYLLGYVQGEQGNFEGMVDSYDKSLAISKNFEKILTTQENIFGHKRLTEALVYIKEVYNQKMLIAQKFIMISQLQILIQHLKLNLIQAILIKILLLYI